MRRPRVVVAAIMALCVSLATACSSSGSDSSASGGGGASGSNSKSLGTLTVSFPIAENLSIINWVVAQGCGFWAKQGLKVKFAFGTTGTDNVGALTSGRAQVTYIDMGGLGNLVDKGQTNLRAVYQWNPINIFQILTLKKSGITSLSQLKGKKIGIGSPNSPDDFMLRGALSSVGLSEKDVTLVSVAGTQVAALESGQIDVLSGWDLLNTQIKNAGYPTVNLGLGDSKVLQANMIVASSATLEKQGAAVKAFVTGLRDATLWTVQHPDETFAMAKKEMPSQTQAETAAKNAVQTRIDSFAAGYQQYGDSYGAPDVATWQKAADLLQKVGAISKTFDVGTYVDKNFLPTTKFSPSVQCQASGS